MSLSALIKKGWLRDIATVTSATSATEVKKSSQSVAAVATVAVAQAQSKAANDPAKGQDTHPQEGNAPSKGIEGDVGMLLNEVDSLPIADLVPNVDLQCWPHTQAMNTAEIDVLKARINLFMRHGLDYTESEALADGLVIRDRELDDRRLCLECRHLRAVGDAWVCTQWRQAGLVGSAVPTDSVKLFQRCRGFK